jgi:hypothetical protein
MANWSKSYTKTPVNITKLTMEIEDDGLTPNLVGIEDDNSGSNNLTVTFDAEVTGGELTTLDATVAAHDGAAATYYTIYCYDCGCAQGARALATLTACPVCSGTDIQTAYHNDNLDATTDPTVDDDDTAGYCEGSNWLNKTLGKAFICMDNTTGAAVWKQTSYALDSDEGLSDTEYTGLIVEKTVGEDVAFKDVLYLKSDSKFWKGDADAEATADGMCVMACETILADAVGKVMIIGFFRDDSDNWTVGGKFFISTTPGGPTQTEPSGSGDIVRIIGHATHADRGFFNPDNSYVEVP